MNYDKNEVILFVNTLSKIQTELELYVVKINSCYDSISHLHKKTLEKTNSLMNHKNYSILSEIIDKIIFDLKKIMNAMEQEDASTSNRVSEDINITTATVIGTAGSSFVATKGTFKNQNTGIHMPFSKGGTPLNNDKTFNEQKTTFSTPDTLSEEEINTQTAFKDQEVIFKKPNSIASKVKKPNNNFNKSNSNLSYPVNEQINNNPIKNVFTVLQSILLIPNNKYIEVVDENGNLIKRIYNNENISIVGEITKDNIIFCKVQFEDGSYGYVEAKYLLVQLPTSNPFNAIASLKQGTECNIFERVGFEDNIISTCRNGDTLNFTGRHSYDKKWFEVDLSNGDKGYIDINYLEINNQRGQYE